MSEPGQPRETSAAEIEPWGETVSFYSPQLELTLEMPSDWRAAPAADCPLQILAPPRGQPPFQAVIRIFVHPAPPGPEMLPLVVEEIFEAARTPAMLDYEAAATAKLALGTLPAFLHRSSWGLNLPNGQRVDLRQQMLVVAALDRLYIYSLIVPPALIEAASEVFINMLQTARYGPAGTEAAQSERPAGPNAGGPKEAAPAGRVDENGRWRSRRSLGLT